ncbi:Major facilitator superfamily domain general substrate transporter [Penicillium psychrosexuale]|uniref:Major facilitator superfamily domain general substrate transporter n=1 Tax=Penicillium psychrosexuale TaxID=1002107 RepID=UPI002544F9E1|nr:Major facilitator superfamily domain general substrate transporter [Penicillium psychrosexuale]KAJ5791523.1 Major facilitator superfamily domain general substrate transporter [Penicillium psychrosexuale]
MSFPQPTPTAISREHVDEVKEAISLTPTGKGNGDDNNLDDIAQILMDQEGIEYPAEEHRKLLRNIDWRIVPLAAWVCGLRFVDKVHMKEQFLPSHGFLCDIIVWSWPPRHMVFAMIFTLLAKSTLGVFLYGSPAWPSQDKTTNEGIHKKSSLCGLIPLFKKSNFELRGLVMSQQVPYSFQMLFSQTAGSVTTNFLGIVIKGFGYTALKAQLYTAPNYAIQAVTQLLVSGPPTFFVFFRNKKQPLAALASIVGVIGIIILYVTPPEEQYQHRRLAGCIIISASGVNYTVIMSIIGANFVGFTRKQTVTSAAFFLYCVANIVTPQTFLGEESPQYHTGLAFVLACLSIYIVLSTTTWVVMRVENNRRESRARENPEYVRSAGGLSMLSGLGDQTDLQNKRFRYSG